jgi:hypothetical protein
MYIHVVSPDFVSLECFCEYYEDYECYIRDQHHRINNKQRKCWINKKSVKFCCLVLLIYNACQRHEK